MDKKQYIQKIRKYLTCDQVKKNDICMELETDIDEAMKLGESWSEVMQRLGDPKSVANEFNDNLGLPHKTYKKPILIGSLIGIVVIMIAGIIYFQSQMIQEQPLGTSQIFEQSQVEEAAKQVVDYLNDDEFDKLYSLFDDIMKKSLTHEKLTQSIKSLGELGEFQKITDQKYVEIKQSGKVSVVGDVVVLYEKRTIIYRVTFDEKMQLSGLYMR